MQALPPGRPDNSASSMIFRGLTFTDHAEQFAALVGKRFGKLAPVIKPNRRQWAICMGADLPFRAERNPTAVRMPLLPITMRCYQVNTGSVSKDEDCMLRRPLLLLKGVRLRVVPWPSWGGSSSSDVAKAVFPDCPFPTNSSVRFGRPSAVGPTPAPRPEQALARVLGTTTLVWSAVAGTVGLGSDRFHLDRTGAFDRFC